ASTCVNLGNLCGRRAQPSPAAAAFEEVIQLFPEASRATLGSPAKSLLETAYTGRAFARESQGDLDGMVRDCETAITLASTARARKLRVAFANVLAADKQPDRALAMVDPLLKDRNLDGPSAFELSLLYVSSAAAAKQQNGAAHEKERAALVDRQIEQAIKLLQRANEGRYFADRSNRKKLHDPPFVPLLTGNAAFQKLLQAVEKVPSEVPAAGPAAATR
ncbi:MAG TPA: hypothetical protein VGY54_11040, partial [Polyangiaceae bacterium]|nr:hypothetical protein [Polyangiaceae bacterium]